MTTTIGTCTKKVCDKKFEEDLIAKFNIWKLSYVLDIGACFSSLRFDYKENDRIVYLYFDNLYKEVKPFVSCFNNVFKGSKIKLIQARNSEYLFRIMINRKYSPIAKFVMCYMISCILRIFCPGDFNKSITEDEIKEDIVSAIIKANKHCNWLAHALSEKVIKREALLFLDNIELMNKYLDEKFILYMQSNVRGYEHPKDYPFSTILKQTNIFDYIEFQILPKLEKEKEI